MLNICSVLKHKAKIVKQWLYIYVFAFLQVRKGIVRVTAEVCILKDQPTWHH